MLVTCLCLTRNRRQWLPKAIEGFLSQTYAHRELLIVADGEDVQDLIPNDARIRLLQIDGKTEIGDKRNLGCDRAAGEIIATWDDDDYSSPERLSDQLARLNTSGKAVTGYHSMRFTDGASWWHYRGANDCAIGTSLCYRKDWWQAHRFPSYGVGEDNFFVAVARASGQLTTADDGDLMHATVHPGNTSRRMMVGPMWQAL